MHHTDPGNVHFNLDQSRVYSTPELISYPGNSGGPMCVQYTNRNQTILYYPAAIFVGMRSPGEAIFRLIDPEVALLIQQADASSKGGDQSTGGGVIRLSAPSLGGTNFNLGGLSVRLMPISVIDLGAAWRMLGVSDSYHPVPDFTSTMETVPVNEGEFHMEFRPITGFVSPTARLVQIVANQKTEIEAEYLEMPQLRFDPRQGIILSGLPGQTYRLEYTDNLWPNPEWLPLNTNTLTGASTLTINPGPSVAPQRFFRLVWVPLPSSP
jgi:hypothetical protein